MNAGDVTTQLDKRIAAALKATAGTVGPLRGSVDRLNEIYNLFKAHRASCKMTEAEYAEKATQFLDILGDFEGKLCGVTAKAIDIATDLTAFDSEIAAALPP